MDTCPNNWDDVASWLASVAGQESVSGIARRIGVPQRTLANYVKKDQLPAEVAIAVARAYSYDPIDALVDHGYLTGEECAEFASARTAELIPVQTLLQAAGKRLENINALLDHATTVEDTAFAGYIFRSEYAGQRDAPLRPADRRPSIDEVDLATSNLAASEVVDSDDDERAMLDEQMARSEELHGAAMAKLRNDLLSRAERVTTGPWDQEGFDLAAKTGVNRGRKLREQQDREAEEGGA